MTRQRNAPEGRGRSLVMMPVTARGHPMTHLSRHGGQASGGAPWPHTASEREGEGGMEANTGAAQTKPRPKMPRKAGDLAGLKRRLWWSVLHCEHLLTTAESDEMILRAVHAPTQVSGAFMKALEVDDLERRIAHLEQLMISGGTRHGQPQG